MSLVYFYGMALSMGAIMAIYLPVLSQSGRIIGSPILANIPFFGLGMITSLILDLIMGNKLSDFSKLGDVPVWMFFAGVASGLMILGSTWLIPKIGVGAFFVLLVTGQIVFGALISHFGMLGTLVDALSLRKLAGLALVVGGSYLVTFK